MSYNAFTQGHPYGYIAAKDAFFMHAKGMKQAPIGDYGKKE
jgi:hypothetical protein